MRIIIINHYAGSPKMGMEYRPFYLAKEWIKLGHDVRIIGSSFSHLRSFNPDIKENISIDIIENIEYCWIKTPKYKGNGFPRVINIFVFLFKLFYNRKRVIYSFNPDVIISSSTYPLDGVLANILRKNTKIKLVHEIHDLWPLTLKLLGGFKSFHPFIFLLQLSENFVYKNCDTLVSILPGTLPYLRDHGLSEQKFFHVPNGYFETQFLIDIPFEHMNLIVDLRKQQKFIVLYAGGHNISNALKYLILAAEIVSDPEVAIVLVGDGTEKETLIEKVMSKRLKNVYFLPPVPKESVPNLLILSDILYLGWSNSPLYDFGISPNKIFDYMLASKPIIHSYSGKFDLVKKANCGTSVKAENFQEIAEAINEMKKKNYKELSDLGKNGYSYVTHEHNYSFLAKQFINILK